MTLSVTETSAGDRSPTAFSGQVTSFLKESQRRGMRVAGGTSEIQRNLIGERLLGLPR